MQNWLAAAAFAVPVVMLVAWLYYDWFALSDRYFIFLYYHYVGDSAPFGAITITRYWMTGLVAAGTVMLLYLPLNFTLGRLFRGYRAPDWRRIWLLCALPLAILIPALVMSVNEPVMPPGIAALITLVLLIGLGLALPLGSVVAETRIGALLLLLLDAAAMSAFLLFQHFIEVRGRLNGVTLIALAVILLVGLAGLGLLTGLYRWRRSLTPPTAPLMLLAFANLNYLFLPMLHHWVFSYDPPYISDAANFFAGNLLLQVSVWIVLGLVAWGVAWLRSLKRPASDSSPHQATG